jgi:hypothetical protein
MIGIDRFVAEIPGNLEDFLKSSDNQPFQV